VRGSAARFHRASKLNCVREHRYVDSSARVPARKLEMVDVPYKGLAPAITDLLGGQVLLMIGDTPENFAAIVRAETVKWGKVAKETGQRINLIGSSGEERKPRNSRNDQSLNHPIRTSDD